MNLLGQCCTAAKESNYYDQQITCQNDINMICCSAWCHVLNVYFCPSNIFQLPFKVAIGAKHAQLSYLNQHILELQPILGTLSGCFSLHNQPTSPPTIRIIGHVALNQRLIKIRNHLNRWTLWIEPSAKILTIRIQVTCMAGILETEMLQPCSFSMSVYDNTIQHLQVCGPELLHVIWLAGFCPSSLASKPCSLFRKSRKKWTFSLRLINAEIVRCWNLLWNSTIPSPESIQPDSSPGNGPHKKKHTDKFWGVHTLCIHPLRYLYEFIDPSSHRSKALAVDRKRPPEFLRAVVAFDSLATQGPEAKQLIAASYICLNKLECQFY